MPFALYRAFCSSSLCIASRTAAPSGVVPFASILGAAKRHCICPVGEHLGGILVTEPDEQELNALACRGIALELVFQNLQSSIQLIDRLTDHRARSVEHKRTRQSLALCCPEGQHRELQHWSA